MQNILMIAPTSFFADYGCHVRIWEEIKALQKLGHRLTLATYHNGDDMPGIDIRRSWDVPWLKRAMVGSSRHKLYLDAALSWRSLRVALQQRPTIIHAHLHEGALIGAVLRRLLRVPLIFDYQGSLSSEMLDHGFLKRSSATYPLWLKLEQQINRQADMLITSNHNAADLLRREGSIEPTRLHTVIDSVNTDRFRPFDGSPEWEAQRRELRAQLGIPAGRRIVAYIGLLAPYQGTNILIEAASMLAAQLPDVHFLIMGYPDPASYRAYAASLGIADRVTLPGRIYYRDLHSYLAIGEVAVAPKMSMTEGSGKIPNYMAMGMPIVTFDTPVSREFLGDLGIYAAFGSAADLAAGIRAALDRPAWAADLGRRGRERAVQELSWERAGHQIEAIYAAALTPATTPAPRARHDSRLR
ncbi:MAG TPA: glycosyltransferase family 4 protein [Roseiflexaceae bacterium]|nr:glycosyltransferase family 4 protein [Roseiflexaceae bacterium]